MSNIQDTLLNYVEVVKTKAPTRHVSFAQRAETLVGLDLAQIVAGVTKTHIGLSAVLNYDVSTVEQARAGHAASYLTPARTTTALVGYFPTGEEGQVLYGNGSVFEADRPLRRLAVVVDDDELLAAQNATESFETVFTYWKRFSHRSGYPQPGIEAELDAWTYDSSSDTISCALNTVSHVGFVSPDQHHDYVFEVEVSSVDRDDDFIGIVLAFTVENGIEHTLTAYRSFNGSAGSHLTVTYDLGVSGGSMLAQKILGPEPNPYYNGGGGDGWSGKKVRIKAERTGDVISVVSTQPDATVYEIAQEIVIDLTTLPTLEKFRGGTQIGYMCQSQRYSTWSVLQRPGARSTIVDLRTYTTHQWSGSGWVVQASDAYQQYLKAGRFYFNELSGKLYYCMGNKDVVLFGRRGG